MKIRQAVLAGMMGLATISPAKAQQPIRFGVEGGLLGHVRQEVSLYGGLNLSHKKGKNFAGLFGGLVTNGTKNGTCVAGIVSENYSWTKNLSSWFRGTGTANTKNINGLMEISPVRGNVSAGNFDFVLNPSYDVHADYKAKNITQGLGAIFQTTYSISPSDKLFLEMKYSSTPARKLSDTEFGSLKDNMSYIVSYQKTF